MEQIEYLGETIHRWQVGASTFLAAPEKGARMMNWNITFPDGTFRDVIRWPDLQSQEQFVKARGGNPILFPFCARTYDKGDLNFWIDAAGRRRPMPMHGFARQGRFEIIRIDDTGFAARLVPDEAAKEYYPYEYDFDVVYRFDDREFTVELRLANHDKVEIPWSAGHHFYFNLPWLENTTRSDYAIKIPARKACKHAADGSLSDTDPPNKSESIATPEIIDRIHYGLTSHKILCECPIDDSKIEIEIGSNRKPDPDKAVVTWTEADDSPFFCIEPWMGPPNSPENKIGLHTVSPGEAEAFSVTVRI